MDAGRRDELRAARLAAPLHERPSSGALHTVAPLEAADTLARLADALEPALPGFEDVADLVITGSFAGSDFTAGVGRLVGRHWTPLARRGRTARLAQLHYGRIDRWDGTTLAETWLILDIPDALLQLGLWPAAPPLGASLFPAPPRYAPAADPAAALARVEAMIAGLMRYDGTSLASMAQRDHWNTDFRWHGPAAIGALEGFEDYERGHQAPFLAAFPDRVGGNHVARIAEGPWVFSGGWPSIRATHAGPGWLGLPATGRAVTMRVMDLWRYDPATDKLAENWVFLDIPHLLHQLGLDAFERLPEIMGG